MRLDPGDEAGLKAVPLGHWIEVSTAGETFRLARVPGGWHVPGDVASGDLVDGEHDCVEVLGDLFGDDPYDERDDAEG